MCAPCDRGPLRIAEEIKGEGYLCDFTQLDNVHGLAAQVRRRHARIDLLVNNAACLTRAFALTEDGHERTSITRPRDQHQQRGPLDGTRAGGNLSDSAWHDAHTCLQQNQALEPLHAVEINRRTTGVRAVSFHPGAVATAIARGAAMVWRLLTETNLKRILRTPAQGADTLLWLVDHMHDGVRAGGLLRAPQVSVAQPASLRRSVGRPRLGSHPAHLAAG